MTASGAADAGREPDTLSIAWERMNVARADAELDAAAVIARLDADAVPPWHP